MRKIIVFVLSVILAHLSYRSQAQLVDDMDDESKLYAETKQVNQFFRRFNGEEDEQGNRYYSKDRQYRDDKLRKKYLDVLFDKDNQSLSRALKQKFAEQVLDKANPQFLEFHGGQWFAEVNTTFRFNGKIQPVTLFLTLENERLGSKWAIFKVDSDIFGKYFEQETGKSNKFLHPMSHELDFMNLRKAFTHPDSINQYTTKDFKANHLSLFIYEINRGNLKYETVKTVKFHFFQIDGWYFELSQFNRSGYNTGWLISNLVEVKEKKDKALLRNYILHEK